MVQVWTPQCNQIEIVSEIGEWSKKIQTHQKDTLTKDCDFTISLLCINKIYLMRVFANVFIFRLK